jgi:para-aminobenzoate synthetase/4-amino-4-deoxychorismate lyase
MAAADDFQLIETFRWSAGEGFIRLDRHLGRLAASAAALGFAFDPLAARLCLARVARGLADRSPDQRVRMVLARTGALTTGHEPLEAPAPPPVRVVLAPNRLDAADPLLRHKTTRRAAYDMAQAFATARGADEALLLNGEGALADGARSSLFVQRAGRLLTPPVRAGALPGVLRAELIAGGRAVESELGPQDLSAGDVLFIGSSLRGLRPALLV